MKQAQERTRPEEELGCGDGVSVEAAEWGGQLSLGVKGVAVKIWRAPGGSIYAISSVEKSGLEIKIQSAQLNVFLLL